VRQFIVSNSNTIYRIYVGPIESLDKAQELCGEIQKRGVDKCQPVIN
jgi:cell division septation protein DedD